MDKDLLELERKHLSQLILETDEAKFEKVCESFLIVYTYDAVGMEGKNKIPFEDVKRLLHTKSLLDYSEREQKEILNHAEAYHYVVKEAKANQPLDEEKLKDIHEMLVKDIFQGGVYRNVNIQIKGGMHQPPDYVKVYDRMHKYFQTIDQYSNDPIEKAVFAHASLAKIHPFLDGNGRLARLVMNYILIQNDYLPVSIPIDLRSQYIKHLETFKVEKQIKPLVQFVKELLLKRYQDVEKRLEESA
ncbi:MAG: Fic family protein [Acholeplasmataceae bacterium]